MGEKHIGYATILGRGWSKGLIKEQKAADLRAVILESRDRGLEYGQYKARRKHNREAKRSSRLSECSP